jgi:hypothetical protein
MRRSGFLGVWGANMALRKRDDREPSSICINAGSVPPPYGLHEPRLIDPGFRKVRDARGVRWQAARKAWQEKLVLELGFLSFTLERFSGEDEKMLAARAGALSTGTECGRARPLHLDPRSPKRIKCPYAVRKTTAA